MEGLLQLTPAHALAERLCRLRAADPLISISEAAVELDVAEAELLASLCGSGALRLDGPFGDLVRTLPALGRVRSITRNRLAAIETRGVYPAPEVGCAGVAGEIGARFFPEQWRYGYALDEATSPDGGTGLFFYDARGQAVHEVHAEIETDQRRLARLIDLFASFDQSTGEELMLAAPHMLLPRTDLSAWLRQAEDVRTVAVGVLPEVLEAAHRDAIAVSVAVRSAGVVQRFSGILHDVAMSSAGIAIDAPWVRVQVKTQRIAEAWVVHTPTLDGPATSLELLDASASVVLSLSGARWPGKPEQPIWRDLLAQLPTAGN